MSFFIGSFARPIKLLFGKAIGSYLLYNLVDDIHEDCDLAAQYPDRVEDMKRIVFEQHVENPYFKVTMPQ